MFNKREKQFRKAVQTVFSTSDGKLILKYLKEDYIDKSSYSDNPHQAYYMMGQADVIKGLIQLMQDEDRDELESLSVSQFEDY